MTTYKVRYSSYVEVEVEAEDKDSAVDKADEVLLGFTGTDFRNCVELSSIKELV